MLSSFNNATHRTETGNQYFRRPIFRVNSIFEIDRVRVDY